MNVKTPISALQELMARNQQELPVYIEGNGGTLGFKCTVHAGGITGVGYGATKKGAKHDSAKDALQKLRNYSKSQVIIVQNSSPIERPLKNYVGELNEYSSKHGVSYAVYDFITTSISGEFFFNCTFMGKQAQGRGLNKKDAKQDAAKNMLKLCEGVDSSKYKIIQVTNTFESQDTEKIIAAYKSFSLFDNPSQCFSQNSEIKPSPEIKIDDCDSVEMLKAQLQKYNIEYQLKDYQINPHIICLTINNTDFTFLGRGNTREEAVKKVLRNLLELKKSGCLLNSDLISFV